jgi:hypothetical protein
MIMMNKIKIPNHSVLRKNMTMIEDGIRNLTTINATSDPHVAAPTVVNARTNGLKNGGVIAVVENPPTLAETRRMRGSIELELNQDWVLLLQGELCAKDQGKGFLYLEKVIKLEIFSPSTL